MLFSRKAESRTDPTPEPPIAQGPPPAVPRRRGLRNADSVRSQSFIDASITIMGDLHSEGDVQLDGQICGNISCGQLIVGRDATITGAVTAEQAIVRGRITGTIRSPLVILQETARVESEITYRVLAIDEGATFEGAARRSENPLQESDRVSALVELQRIAAGRAAANGHDAHTEIALQEPGAAPAADGQAESRPAATRA